MVSVRKRKMARSSVPKNTKKEKDKKKQIKVKTHPVLRKLWDHKLTVKQNYEKLGLAHNLTHHKKGGEEPALETVTQYRERKEAEEERKAAISPESIANETDPEKIPLGEARIIRDPETNEVVKVIHGKMVPKTSEPQEEKYSVVDDLQKYNKEHAKPSTIFKLPEMEVYYLERLSKKYGDNYERMVWDQKLNPNFMSKGQLKNAFARLERQRKLEAAEELRRQQEEDEDSEEDDMEDDDEEDDEEEDEDDDEEEE